MNRLRKTIGRSVLILFGLVALCRCGSSGSGGNPTAGGHQSSSGSQSNTATGLCVPLAPPTGKVTLVTPSQAGQLASLVASAQTGDTISLADGTYSLGSQDLEFQRPGVTLRSASGNRDAVILDGGYTANQIGISASNITISGITIQRLIWHPLHVYAPEGSSTTIQNTLIDNVHIIDPGEQGIKINANSNYTAYVDAGEIRCSLIEMTSAGRQHVVSWDATQGLTCYTGGIDGHAAMGWKVHDNTIQGFWCASGLSEHAIHFWDNSRDTLIERNRLFNNARGVGLGLGSSGGTNRSYSDGPCSGITGYIGHYNGIVRNNFIWAGDLGLFSSANGMDSGIALEQSCDTKILHNSVISTSQPLSSSIEYRFPESAGGAITNNLVSYRILSRDGGTATLSGNLESAPLSLFADVTTGDLHLLSTASQAIGQGVPITDGSCTQDIDGNTRDSAPDLGADEYE